jgi:hypothetical protein
MIKNVKIEKKNRQMIPAWKRLVRSPASSKTITTPSRLAYVYSYISIQYPSALVVVAAAMLAIIA